MTPSSIHPRRATFAAIWQPVFGAYVALQHRDHMRDFIGVPDEEHMRAFIEEAAAVADAAVDAWEALGR